MTLAEFIHHGPLAVAFIVTGAASLAVLVIVATRSSQLGLREEEFLVQVNRLIHAGNVERAAKLCAAGKGRPVAQLVGVGVDVLIRSDLGAANGVERAKAAMAGRLPDMLRALVPGMVAVATAAALTTALGTLVGAQFSVAAPWGVVLGFVAPVDGLAAWTIAARFRVRRDLARVVADFGSLER
jgi:hypothetical protein